MRKDRQSGAPLNIPTDVVLNEITDNYSLVAADNGEVLKVNKTTSVTITLPDGLPKGFSALVVMKGAGSVVFSTAGTLESIGTTLATQYTAATVIHEGSNVWGVYGDLT
jgi:hypothetical protein